ncbi:hypothetical protein BX600DRAFT_517960 [Xylariales sp. PMI_506]|nr:hypothetical protein BX600DRAFT_517960 [Xylariales sp. PMI_506]
MRYLGLLFHLGIGGCIALPPISRHGHYLKGRPDEATGLPIEHSVLPTSPLWKLLELESIDPDTDPIPSSNSIDSTTPAADSTIDSINSTDSGISSTIIDTAPETSNTITITVTTKLLTEALDLTTVVVTSTSDATTVLLTTLTVTSSDIEIVTVTESATITQAAKRTTGGTLERIDLGKVQRQDNKHNNPDKLPRQLQLPSGNTVVSDGVVTVFTTTTVFEFITLSSRTITTTASIQNLSTELSTTTTTIFATTMITTTVKSTATPTSTETANTQSTVEVSDTSLQISPSSQAPALAPTTANNDNNDNNNSLPSPSDHSKNEADTKPSGLNTGTKATVGIAVAAAGISMLVAGIWFFLRKCRTRSSASSENSISPPMRQPETAFPNPAHYSYGHWKPYPDRLSAFPHQIGVEQPQLDMEYPPHPAAAFRRDTRYSASIYSQPD